MRLQGGGTRLTWVSHAYVLVLLLFFLTPSALSDNESSIIAPLARQSLILDGAVAGDTIVVVGERGHILKSLDQGNSWYQVSAPTRATLTAVAFFDANHGIAVGHDAVILRSQDGGESWQRVHHAPQEEKPLLDVYIHSQKQITVIGAYGLYLHSKDGGSTWGQREFQPLDPDEPSLQNENVGSLVDDFHLNQIAVSDTGRWYIAAEAGTLYRSDDQGSQWRQLPSPYEGSFFGILPLKLDEILVFGLQGRLFYSNDAGQTWQRVETRTQATLTNALRLRQGGIAVTGYSGSILFADQGRAEFKLTQLEQRMGISSSIQLKSGDLLLLGTGGMLHLPLEQLTN